MVTVTSFGRVPVRAELRDAAGTVLARAAGRTDDWNIALSRFLPAGRYQLALAPLFLRLGVRHPTGQDAQDTGSNDNGPATAATAANDRTAANDKDLPRTSRPTNPPGRRTNRHGPGESRPKRNEAAGQPEQKSRLRPRKSRSSCRPTGPSFLDQPTAPWFLRRVASSM